MGAPVSGPQDNAPTSFDAARRWTASRVNVLNRMSSRELALSPAFGAEAKARAFFSAKVAQANVLDKLRAVSDDFSSGKVNLAEARTKLKTFLNSQNGNIPDDVTASRGQDRRNRLDNLASTARLDLILNQNARMAAAVGQREVSLDPDILERWPYFRYIPSRSAHRRASHQAFYNLVLPKTDPFWRTHTPPLDFNCKCSIEDADKEDADSVGGVSQAVRKEGGEGGEGGDGNGWAVKLPSGQALSVDTPASGYIFDVGSALDTCDMSRVKDIPTRRAVLQDMRQYAKDNPDIRLKIMPSLKPLGTPAVEAADLKPAHALVEKWLDGKAESGEAVKLGSLSAGMCDALGIEYGFITLQKGNGGRGLEHMAIRHKPELADGRFLQALADTIHAVKPENVVTSIVFSGKKAMMTLRNVETGAFATLIKNGDGGEWGDWDVVSAHYPGDIHGEIKEVMW